MSFHPSSKLAAYQMVATHGGVAAADPHRLILMLMDGALSRFAQARGCMERGEKAEKCQHLQRALAIVGELRGSLDLGSGGALAVNLDRLYDYLSRQLLRAHASEDTDLLDHCSTLMQEIRSAWIAIPASARNVRQAAG